MLNENYRYYFIVEFRLRAFMIYIPVQLLKLRLFKNSLILLIPRLY